MANKASGTVSLKTVEFLLDLPEDFSVTDIRLENDEVTIDFVTELDVPSNVKFNYQLDDYGNIALTGLDT